jgi:hypothetical protein
MPIGAINVQPYNYDTGRNDPAGTNIARVSQGDLNAGRTSQSEPASNGTQNQQGENTNPLRPGETADFAGVVENQMSLSRQNADRVMVPGEANAEENNATAGVPAQGNEAVEAMPGPNAGTANETPVAEAAARDDIAAGAVSQINEETAGVETAGTAVAAEWQISAVPANDENNSRGITAVITEEGVFGEVAQSQGQEIENFQLETNNSAVSASSGTAFANVISDGAGLPAGEEAAAEADEAAVAQQGGQNQPINMTNPEQMRFAADNYAMVMGL